MSHALSNLSLSLPLTSKTTPKPPKILHLITPNYKSFAHNIKPIRAQASGETRDNLDHLQRATKPHQTQQNKKRVAPVSPTGLWDRFPTARTVQQMMQLMKMNLAKDYWSSMFFIKLH